MNTRPMNQFVHCGCGVTYISGYKHCPKCGVQNPIDKQDDNKNREYIAETFDAILEEVKE